MHLPRMYLVSRQCRSPELRLVHLVGSYSVQYNELGMCLSFDVGSPKMHYLTLWMTTHWCSDSCHWVSKETQHSPLDKRSPTGVANVTYHTNMLWRKSNQDHISRISWSWVSLPPNMNTFETKQEELVAQSPASSYHLLKQTTDTVSVWWLEKQLSIHKSAG